MLLTAAINEKLAGLDSVLERALCKPQSFAIPMLPARDVRTVPISELRGKPGLSTAEGQGRLLHDVANIELQAMELAFRSLVEFPEAPADFRQELAALVLSEAKHLKLCLEGLDDLGFAWGHWPIHLALWESVDAADSLLHRILIVHRYLEGSGLDAGHAIQRKLTGFNSSRVRPILDVIVREEIDHVNFGSKWFRRICKLEGQDSHVAFVSGLKYIEDRVPKRMEALYVPFRKSAGFSDEEIQTLLLFQRREL